MGKRKEIELQYRGLVPDCNESIRQLIQYWWNTYPQSDAEVLALFLSWDQANSKGGYFGVDDRAVSH